MLVVKRLYGWSYEQTEHFVSDSIIQGSFVASICRAPRRHHPDPLEVLTVQKPLRLLTTAPSSWYDR